jgi:hypothetical protein
MMDVDFQETLFNLTRPPRRQMISIAQQIRTQVVQGH